MDINKLPKFKYHPNIYDGEKVIDGVEFENEWLGKGGSPAGYLFRCLHCGKYRLNVDFD